ncbi:DMT family transporter [Thalassotalea euphylliae]|uniref:DMT family transporter n=1 Tax=Thalassotalea euphylliae TaxID=1655234 RepID=A0A3E0TPW3_9GAMM|nr:DMT family transporter [Thalassotalea euphylliae]REL26538.1 DMT family transporter [Thalassotalea euphylliae]
MPINAFLELLFLASLWGASFLFMRIGSPEFGPFLLVALRTLTASLFLLPILMAKRQHQQLSGRWPQIFIMGAFNTAIPFALFGYALLSLSAGVGSVLNATAPIFAAIVAFIWLKDRISIAGIMGLLLGFFGVYMLMSGKISSDGETLLLPTLAALSATLCYAIATNYTKQYLHDLKPLALAAGSQISSTLMLLPFALWFLPSEMPSHSAFYSVAALGVFCTGIAYILFFRLIASVGPTKAISVTYLIPVFGLLWGYLFLAEPITLSTLAGSGCILLGVGLTTGLFSRRFAK